jgi:hypothetical protein
MNKTNYAKLCEEELKKEGTREKTLLLHSCCAPCSSYCLTFLHDKIKIKDLYYNPNILDKEEYEKRESELKRLIEVLKEEYKEADIEFVKGDFESGKFLSEVKGLESEPEGGKRCEKCFRLRLKEAASKAKELGADYFGTTLTISPLKNAELINTIGFEIEKETGVKYLPSDFKKNDGYKQSIELSRKYGLYRQNYCGCPYSKREEK